MSKPETQIARMAARLPTMASSLQYTTGADHPL
jgi:hypothetical protein